MPKPPAPQESPLTRPARPARPITPHRSGQGLAPSYPKLLIAGAIGLSFAQACFDNDENDGGLGGSSGYSTVPDSPGGFGGGHD